MGEQCRSLELGGCITRARAIGLQRVAPGELPLTRRLAILARTVNHWLPLIRGDHVLIFPISHMPTVPRRLPCCWSPQVEDPPHGPSLPSGHVLVVSGWGWGAQPVPLQPS